MIDDAGRSLRSTVHGLEVNPDGTRSLHTLTDTIAVPPEAEAFAAAAATRMNDIAVGPLSGLDMDDARTVVVHACALKDVAEALDHEELAGQAESALVNFGGNATLRFRVADLARSMATAERTEAAVGQAAVFALCETA
ncbi:hypothetical protein [Streptomyces sp. NPDC001930]|uniref:hypothetical protein n=1 Tax=Streptomyces sp. NPDC001930 TaxID=3364625 RepID=UPI0036C3414D